MSEFDDIAAQPDSNSVDNGFEKLDPLSTPETESAEDIVSSTQSDVPTDDLLSGIPEVDTSPQLVDLGFSSSPAAIPEPEPFVPEPIPEEKPTEPTPTPSPIPTPTPISLPLKPAVSSTSASGSTCWMHNIDPRVTTADVIPGCVIELIYWRDLKKSGIVFGSLLILLLSLALFSVLSVVAYLSLAALTVTITFVVYKKVLGAVQKTGDGHPFRPFLEYDVSLPEEKLHEVADVVMSNSTTTLKELRRLFLVEDLVDSLKFGLLLWVLTYIGSWFNGMTLIILAVVGVFTLPKFYETYKVQIDQNIELVRTQVTNVMTQIKEKIPLPGKKKKEE